MDTENSTALKVSVLGVFLVCIFPHFRICRVTPYLVQMPENTYQKKPKYAHFKKCRGLARPLVFWCFQKVYKGNISTE